MEQILIKKLFIWAILSLNLIFAFIIGVTIPQLETYNSQIFGYVMIPLLIILNFIIVDRFHFYIVQLEEREDKHDDED